MSDPVILVEPDPFIGVGANMANYIPDRRMIRSDSTESQIDSYGKKDGAPFDLTELAAVSRPLNGIIAKPNTHAYVQVMRSDMSVVKVFNQLGIPHDYAMSGSVDKANMKDYIEQFKKDGSSLFGNPTREGFGMQEPGDAAGGSFGDDLLSKIGSFFGARQGDFNSRNTNVVSKMGGSGIDDKGDPIAGAWTDWILQSVRESRAEKTQLIETFGDSYLYAFGEKPRILAIQGLLMNTVDYNWRAIFWENWDKYFRASRLIEMDARLYLSWEDIIVEGYPLQAQCSESASSPNAMTFSFNMYITNYFNISMANRTQMNQTKEMHALAMSRSSFLGEAVNEQELFDKRLSRKFGANPFNNLMDVGTFGVNAIYEHGISSDGWTYDENGNKDRKLTDFELLGVRQLRELGNFGTRALTGAHTKNPAMASSFLNSYLLQLTFDTLKTTQTTLQQSIADVAGPAFNVEQQNAWFGLIGTMIENFGDGSRWGGTNSDDRFGKAMADAAKAGSMDRLIQQMAYQTVGAMGIGDGVSTGIDTIGDVKAQGGYKKYGALPGAATIVPLVPVDTGASTTSLDGLFGTAEAGDPFGG